MTNAIDPTLGITPSLPFVYGDRPKNQWRMLPQDKNHPNWQDHELVLADLGGGLNKVWGEIFAHYLGVDLGDSAKTSSANGTDPSYPGQLILSTFANNEAVWRGTHYAQCYLYDSLFIGSGSTANLSLYRESTSAAGLAAVTFSPAGAIVSLTPLVFNSTSPILTIGMVGVKPKTLASDLSTTVDLFAAATLWGGIVSPLNANTPGVPNNLLYYGAGLVTVSGDQAATATALQTGTVWNEGGYAVGIANVAVTPGNLVPRAVWVVPRVASTSGMFASAPAIPHADIYHTNLYGTDPQILITNLPWVTWAAINEGVLYYTDGFNIMKNDGKEEDLGWVYEREPNSDYKYLATGLGFARGQLIVAVSRLNLTTVGSSQMWLEKRDPVAKTWQPFTKVLSPNNTTTGTDLGPGYVDRQVLTYPIGSLPYSLKSQMMYLLPLASTGTEKDYYFFIPPTGYSHFWNYRYTASSTKAGQKVEASGTWDSPALSLPWPLKGLPTAIIGVGLYGDVLAGGTGASTDATSSFIKFQQATQGSGGAYSYSNTVYHTVYARDALKWSARWKDFQPSQYDIFNRLKFRFTLNQDTSRSDWSPNALPAIIRMRTFLTGVVE